MLQTKWRKETRKSYSRSAGDRRKTDEGNSQAVAGKHSGSLAEAEKQTSRGPLCMRIHIK